MSEIITTDTLKNDLKNLGIESGDVLFVTIDILKVGFFNKNRNTTLESWIQILLDLVGDNGAIIFASYTPVFFRFNKKNIVFKRDAITTSGSLPNAVIKHEKSIRSTHPTNSVVAIGETVRKLIEKHTPESMSYSIMGDLIQTPNTKFIMIGTIDKNNAPQAMHYVQEELGYTQLNLYKNLLQTYYIENGNKKLFTKLDIGGCSSGGYKLFSYLLIENSINFGKVGNTTAAIMPAQKSYNVIKEVLQRNKKIVKCDNKKCLNCYGNPFYNGFGIIMYFILYFFRAINKIFKYLYKKISYQLVRFNFQKNNSSKS